MTTETEESGRREHPDGPREDGPETGAKDDQSTPDGRKADGSGRKRMLIAAGIAVIVIGAIVVAVNTMGSSKSSASKSPAAPADATTAFLTAVQNNDLPAAFAQLCEPFRKGTPEGVLKPGAVDPLAEAGGLKSFTVGEATISEQDGKSTAATTYELVVGDDQKRAGRAELVLEGEEWKVCSFSV